MFLAHPSVRIKGTEDHYSPASCMEQLCENRTVHMHCPFCIRADFYTDIVILKAHYRVKHVDKGIDFAGLKVLRCCLHCDLSGAIKGEKKFKGAHWHCYKCRNGFNRRDEAIKHYKTHFRNPDTTFQIQIAQEVNQSIHNQNEVQDATNTLQGPMSTIHPALTQAVMTTAAIDNTVSEEFFPCEHDLSVSNGKAGTVAANETIQSSQPTAMFLIKDPRPLTDSSTYAKSAEAIEDVSRVVSEVCSRSEEDESDETWRVRYMALECRFHNLESERMQREQLQKAEIDQLSRQVSSLSEELVYYQQRERVLSEQLDASQEVSVAQLLDSLQNAHRELLHKQLAQLTNAYAQRILQQKNEAVVVSPIEQDDITINGTAAERISPPQHVVITRAGSVCDSLVTSALPVKTGSSRTVHSLLNRNNDSAVASVQAIVQQPATAILVHGRDSGTGSGDNAVQGMQIVITKLDSDTNSVSEIGTAEQISPNEIQRPSENEEFKKNTNDALSQERVIVCDQSVRRVNSIRGSPRAKRPRPR